MGKEKIVVIYTDGSSLGNPGPGGWGAVLIYGRYRKELSGGFKMTTNNRMEVLAAIEALKVLKNDKRLKVRLHTDSSYLVNTMTKGWIENWISKNWKKKNKPIPNTDLWLRLLTQVKKHDVEFTWVPAHTGIAENERCDELAKEAAGMPDLPDDSEYIESLEGDNILFGSDDE
ncbi:ribonuclease HI [Bacteroidota bacterium]